MELRKDYLWGGATAANQYEGGYLEGGKGLCIADVERGARHGVKRQIDPEILPGVFYPSHEATDFYHRWKEDIALFAEMGSNASECPSAGQESIRAAMKKHRMKKD